MKIPQDLLARIVDHARADAPNECCGVVSVRDGVAVGVHPLVNVAASPLKFDVGYDLAGVWDDIERAGNTLGAIYHSHVRSEPYPSQTDINWSKPNWEDVEWIIVGLDGDEATVRSYLIEDGGVREVEVE